jgi:hypothetical protein
VVEVSAEQLAALLFAALALGFAGVAGLMVYEALSLLTRKVPTISRIATVAYLEHPKWFVSIACGVSFTLGALVTHFTHWTP